VSQEREGARFCSRCGRTAAPETAERVCPACGLGLLLWCREADLPGPAFAVVGHDLRVKAVSEAGESLFDDELPDPDSELAAAVRRAAVRRMRKPMAVKAGSLSLLVSTCGPPRAALVSVQEPVHQLRKPR
jgi:DNA-directed RNA polymerase subunit RPC12/RpoP